MDNTVCNHNNHILTTVHRSNVELPSVIAVWRHSREALHGGNMNAALFRCEPDGWHQGAWRINFIDNPLKFIEDGVLVESREDEWLGAQAHKILVKRVSPYPNDNGKYKDTLIRYIGYKIVSNIGRQTIPVLNLNNKSQVLPSEFKKLDAPQHGYLRFKMCYGRLINPSTYRILQRNSTQTKRSEYNPKPLTETKSKTRMPQRVVNVYLDSLINSNEKCPIEFTKLTRENACTAPCGHAMSFSAAKTWLSVSKSCPVCRTELGVDDLMCWV